MITILNNIYVKAQIDDALDSGDQGAKGAVLKPSLTSSQSPKSDREGSRAARLDRAAAIVREDEHADDIAVVTVRVSARLAAYMDRYVARINQVQPKGKYRKQDAVAEAFAAFYADHPMPPEPVGEI